RASSKRSRRSKRAVSGAVSAAEADATPAAEAEFTRRHGVDLRALATTDAWLRPWGYDGLRTLVLGPAQLDLRADPSVTYVGPMVGPVDRVPLPPSVAAAVERHRLGPGAGPLVYCSFGSFVASYDEALLGRLVAAVADEPSWTLLLALGGTRDPDSLGPLPDNVVAERWMPQRRVLDEADLAITHAGIMTILEGVLAGVPLLVRSAGLRDQDGNAARVVHHGLGRLLDREASASTIRDLVEEVRSDRLLADRVTTMRRELLRDDRILERTVADLLAA
ncbi:MAG: nucleotide disphospho-sugar-binding domain-containing protein, partial [Actinomycetota bacterium]